MVVSRLIISLFLMILRLHVLLTQAVWELDKSNFAKFRKAASFPIFFVDSPGCSRCRLLYPFFYAASQTFVEDREIFFGRVQDKSLIRQWGIEELPVILYYEKEETEWDTLEGDITVDNIVETISEAMPGYIGEVKLDHVIEVNDNNYDEIVITPKQNVLLLTHNRGEKTLRSQFEDVAVAFRFDEQIIFCALDSDKYPKLLKERFGQQLVPSVFWYEENEKPDKSIFGAKVHPVTMLQFVNEKTNLWRTKEGNLQPRSGRLSKLDKIFNTSIPDLKEGDAVTISSIIMEMKSVQPEHAWESDFAEYYIELLEKIVEMGSPVSVLSTEKADILTILEEENLTRKQKDYFRRKSNIINFMIDSITEYDEERVRKEMEKKIKERAARKPVYVRGKDEF